MTATALFIVCDYYHRALIYQSVCSRLDEASAPEAVDLGLILNWIGVNTIEIGIYNTAVERSVTKRTL